jgi:F-type H+-transporting ATPase subunit delta
VIDKSIASKVAAPYAEALLDLAKRSKSLDETNQDINIISQFVSNSKDLERFLGNPVVTKESKKTVLKDLLGEQVSASTLKFLMLLVDKDRIDYLGSVADSYTVLAAKESSSEVAEVTSVTQLTTEQQAKLKSKLKQLRGTSNIELVLKVDPTLLGGFVVQIGSSVLDFSLAGALKKMQNHFQSVTL